MAMKDDAVQVGPTDKKEYVLIIKMNSRLETGSETQEWVIAGVKQSTPWRQF